MRILQPILTTCILLLTLSATNAQTVDDIIDKNISATGGRDAWKKITSMRQEGEIDANGTKIAIRLEAVQDKGVRQTMQVAGMSGWVITTPDKGWSFFPWQGQMKAEAMTPEDVSVAQDDMDLQGILVDYKAKGHKAEYLGTDDFEGTECYKIKITEKSGKIITYYIDPSNYFIIHSETITRTNGREAHSASDYSNYKKLPEGIWMPMTISAFGSPFKLKKVEINTTIDENLFKPGI